MRPILDIKVVLIVGYILAYALAVLPAIFVDPALKSHVVYPGRSYPHAYLCLVVFAVFLAIQGYVLKKATTAKLLYVSVCVFVIQIAITLPIFLPEIPHANITAVGATTAILSAFSVFVWSMGQQVSVDAKSLASAREAMFEYMKALITFARQGAFAGVALFGALFFAAYSTGFKFADMTVTDRSDLFLLYWNIGLQVSFYAIYVIVGAVRYFFFMNLHVLSQFKTIAIRLDRDSKARRKRPRKRR